MKNLISAVLLLGGVWFGCTALAAGRQLTGQHAPASTPPLSPAEAQKKFTVPEGFEVRLFAAEPDVVNPVAMAWDDRGRLWVVELYEYPLGAAQGAKPRDRVKILEDVDGDGKADKVTVFADGLNLATGLLLGNGGAYVGQAPDLLFLKDTNGDDVADERKVFMTGFGLEDRHELLNGFTWGPDGWLYMTHGVFTKSKVKDPDRPGDAGVEMTAAVARLHPRTKKFEIFAEGTSNPWGVDYDAAGNMFVSACVIEHLFHMAPGGIYDRQAGSPPFKYAYEQLHAVNDHKHFRAAYAGVQIYQGNQYPEDYKGTILQGNIHDNAVHQDKLTRKGSSFVSSIVRDFVRANDGWFRPVSTQVGPDGAVWIMDWYDKYPCYQNAGADPEGVDRAHGRIWRVVYTGKNPGAAVPSHPAQMQLGQATTAQLVQTLNHANNWQRRTAQRLLDERRDPKTKALLTVMLRDPQTSADGRIAAMWTLGSSGLLDEPLLDATAKDANPVIRTWTARFMGEKGSPTSAVMARLDLLAKDDDAQVRLATATALRQMVSSDLTINTPHPNKNEANLEPVIATLALHPMSGDDPVIPFMVWMAMEPSIAIDPSDALKWLTDNGMMCRTIATKVTTKIMRRICDSNSDAHYLIASQFILGLSPEDAPLTVAALDGLIEGHRGRTQSPGGWTTAFLEKLTQHSDSMVTARARQLGTMWGDLVAIEKSIQAALDDQASEESRINALGSLRGQKSDRVRDGLLRVLKSNTPEKVRIEVLRSLSEVGGDQVAPAILSQWGTLTPTVRRTASEVLSSRTVWALPFLAAVQQKSVAIADIPPTVVRSLSLSKDEATRTRALQVIGRFRESNADKLKVIAEKKAMILTPHGTDLKAGYEIAQRLCLSCHKLYGEGSEVGPDLTGVGRSSLDALLSNVIDPNQIIGHGYENVEVETKDGRSISGRMVENTDLRVRLLAAGPKDEVIAKSEIASLRISEISVMPEGLEQMPDADFRNLMWFILNPPKDNKPISISMRENQLVVQARVPNHAEPVDLVTYVMDPALRPYLHPVKDPTGQVTLTEDKPGDHPWQHGIFTGLHQVNGHDFWTEKAGRQRFVRLTDLVQEQDHVGWRSVSEWVTAEGEVLLEEAQTVTVSLPTSAAAYTIDFDWTLQAGEKSVKIGRYDYGGVAVRMVFDAAHRILNANGATNQAAAGQRATWCDVSRPFDTTTYGIALLDHPSNLGYPSSWRVDGQGLINPSRSLQGDWSVDAHQSRTFHYRAVVHQGAGDLARLSADAKTFAASRLGVVTTPKPPRTDGESIALWAPAWNLVAPQFEDSPRKLPTYLDRANVLMTHPFSKEKGAAFERNLEVPVSKKTVLNIDVASHDQGDWELRIFANGQVLKKEIINSTGERWKHFTVDLSAFAGKKITVRAENAANDWMNEFGYWGRLEIKSTDL